MIGLILLILLTIGLWTGLVIAVKRDNDIVEYLCGLIGGIASVGLLAAIICICVLPSNADYVARNRDRTANLVESINDKMTTETVNDIISKAVLINSDIENHKKHVDSKFSGVFYSRKIAEMEPIVLPELTVVRTTENTE